jgi:hypothetical protein
MPDRVADSAREHNRIPMQCNCSRSGRVDEPLGLPWYRQPEERHAVRAWEVRVEIHPLPPHNPAHHRAQREAERTPGERHPQLLDSHAINADEVQPRRHIGAVLDAVEIGVHAGAEDVRGALRGGIGLARTKGDPERLSPDKRGVRARRLPAKLRHCAAAQQEKHKHPRATHCRTYSIVEHAHRACRGKSDAGMQRQHCGVPPALVLREAPRACRCRQVFRLRVHPPSPAFPSARGRQWLPCGMGEVVPRHGGADRAGFAPASLFSGSPPEGRVPAPARALGAKIRHPDPPSSSTAAPQPLPQTV